MPRVTRYDPPDARKRRRITASVVGRYEENAMREETDDEQTRKQHGMLWYIFCGPGALWMKLRYYNPRSYREDAANFRRMGNRFGNFITP